MGLDGNKPARYELKKIAEKLGLPPIYDEVYVRPSDCGSMPGASLEHVKRKIAGMPYIRMDDTTSSVHTLPPGTICSGANAMVEAFCADARARKDTEKPLIWLAVCDLSSQAPMHPDANIIKEALNKQRRFDRALECMKTDHKFPHHREKTSRFDLLIEKSRDAAYAELDTLFADQSLRDYLLMRYKGHIVTIFMNAMCEAIALRESAGDLTNAAVFVRDQDNTVFYSKRASSLGISLDLPRDAVLGVNNDDVDFHVLTAGCEHSGVSLEIPVRKTKTVRDGITPYVEADLQIPFWALQIAAQMPSAGSEYAVVYCNNDMDSIILTTNWMMWVYEECYLVFGSPPAKPDPVPGVNMTNCAAKVRQVFSVNNYRALLHAMDYPVDDVLGLNGERVQYVSTNSQAAVSNAMERHIALCAIWIGGGCDFLRWPDGVCGEKTLSILTELAVVGPNFFKRRIIDATFKNPPVTPASDSKSQQKPSSSQKKTSVSPEQKETDRLIEVYMSMQMRNLRASHEDLVDELISKEADSEIVPGVDIFTPYELVNESLYRVIINHIGIKTFVPVSGSAKRSVAATKFGEAFSWIIPGTNTVLEYMRMTDALHGGAEPQRRYLGAGVPREPEENFSDTRLEEAFTSWFNSFSIRQANAVNRATSDAAKKPSVVVGQYDSAASSSKQQQAPTKTTLAPHDRTLKTAMASAGSASKYC